MTGTVYKSTGSWYTVKSEQGDFMECRMKGKFRMKGIKSTNPIAVGDVVDYELEQYFARGFELFSVQNIGNQTVGNQLLPVVLYVLTKTEPVVSLRGRKPKAVEA